MKSDGWSTDRWPADVPHMADTPQVDAVALQMARCIKMGSRIHEKSYDHIEADKFKNLSTVNRIDFAQFYRKGIEQSVMEACHEVGCVELIWPVTLMLNHAWSDSIQWAENIIRTTKLVLDKQESIHEMLVIKRIVLQQDDKVAS